MHELNIVGFSKRSSILPLLLFSEAPDSPLKLKLGNTLKRREIGYKDILEAEE